MNVNRLYRPALLACISIAATAACADQGFTFSGFGTVGAVKTNTNEAQFRSGPRQDRGATREVDFGVDTRLGLQAAYQVNETFSGVAQVLTSRRDGKQGPQVEWLYAQASPTQNIDLRLGRMVLPIFMLSDNRNVGYAHHWLRAPQEVYGAYALSSFDGVQARWHDDIGGFNLGARVSAGTSKGDLYLVGPYKGTLKYPRLYSVGFSAEKGFWSLSASKTYGKDVELSYPVFSLPSGGTDTFSNLGIQYDDGHLVAIAEYVTRRYNIDNLVNSNSYYASVGYRFGAWTPYVSYGHFTPKGAGWTAVNSETGEYAPGDIPKGSSRAVGLRWDAYKNVAVKAQFERVRHTDFAFMDPSWPFLLNPPSVRVWSLAVDFVF